MLSWRGSQREATGLIRNELPQLKNQNKPHGKINGRATVNLIINILDSRTNYSSRLKKAKVTKKKKKKYYYL